MNYIEDITNKSRSKDDRVSEHGDFPTMKETLKQSSMKAVQRVVKSTNADCFYGFLLVCCDVAQLAMLNNFRGLVPKLQTTWPPGGLQCKSRSAVCAFGWDFLNMIFI